MKIRKKRKQDNYIAVILIFFGLMISISCNNSGGGNGGGTSGTTPTSFNTANLFPLTSGWQTDKWTLFVDFLDHDINGIATKAMADTQGPKVLYWTNDFAGLRLHAVMDEEGIQSVFQTPILFADRVCRVGDLKTGSYFIGAEEYNYTIELVGIEDVMVPAGYFPNSAIFKFFVYPVSKLPSQYGYETFWLADGVGFVKGQADDNSVSDLFTKSGETRQLLSYHITKPSELSAEEQNLRETNKNFVEYFIDGDMETVETMIDEQYYDERCRDKNTVLADWTDLHDNYTIQALLTTQEDITINGDNGYVIKEELSGYVPMAGGDLTWSWKRVSTRWKKDSQSGEWKRYGVHLSFNPDWLDVWIRNNKGDISDSIIGQFRKCTNNEFIDSPDIISSFTVTGPPDSGIIDLDLMPYWIGITGPTTYVPWFYNGDQLQNAVNGFYTFRVENQNGDYFVTTDYLEVTPPMDLPVLIFPADGAVDVSPNNLTLDWEPVADAEYYRIDLEFFNNFYWQLLTFSKPKDSQYPVPVTLNSNTQYRWQIRARQDDLFRNMDNESKCEYNYFTTLAEPLTWSLDNVTFNDGGIATGSFTIDASLNSVLNWNISVSGGDQVVFPTFNYTPATAPSPGIFIVDGGGV